MKVLYVTSEALPFAASGGLADVAGSLPRALRTRLIGCRVVLPLYESVPQELREGMTFLGSLSVPGGLAPAVLPGYLKPNIMASFITCWTTSIISNGPACTAIMTTLSASLFWRARRWKCSR